MPTSPTPQELKAEIATRALAEAHAMTGPGAGPHPAADLTAAALRTHGTLSAGLGHHVPFTALVPAGGSAAALAAFLAVYAAQERTAA